MQPIHLRTWAGGSLLAVKRASPSIDGPVGGKRGKIKVFSRASRRRLLQTIARLRRDRLPWFITLTYPSDYSTSARAWKTDLKDWAARLKRRYPSAAFVWRLEFQRRGAPHFHLLLYGVQDSLASFRHWISTSWYEVVGSGDEKHLRAGTGAEPMDSFRAAMGYASKELGKTSQARLAEDYMEGVGRWWGAYYRTELPWAELKELELSEANAVKLLRLMRRYARLKNRHYNSLTIFCNADWWFSRLDEMLA